MIMAEPALEHHVHSSAPQPAFTTLHSTSVRLFTGSKSRRAAGRLLGSKHGDTADCILHTQGIGSERLHMISSQAFIFCQTFFYQKYVVQLY